jgi:hypothetical protein
VIVKAWQGPGDIAIYDNVIDVSGPGSTSWLFFREYDGSSTTWAFNNICSGHCGGTNGSIYTQDNSCNQTARNGFTDEDVWVFNNTIEARGGNGVHWQFHFSKMRVRNNIFDGVTYGVRGYYSANEGGCGHKDRAWSESTDLFANNVVENSSGGILDVEPNHKPHAAGHVGIDGTKYSRSAITRRDDRQRLLAPTGVATNDPLGQGAGVCSIALLGETIDCSLDIDGVDRGTVWDVGAGQSPVPRSTD